MPDSGWYDWSSWRIYFYVDAVTGVIISCLARYRMSKDRTIAYDDPSKVQRERRWAIPVIDRQEGPCRSSLVELISDAAHGLKLLGSVRIPIELQNLHRAFWDRSLRAAGDPHGKAMMRCRLCWKPPQLGKGGRFSGLGTEIICGRCMGLRPPEFKARLLAAKGRGRWGKEYRGRVYMPQKNERIEALREEGP